MSVRSTLHPPGGSTQQHGSKGTALKTDSHQKVSFKRVGETVQVHLSTGAVSYALESSLMD